MRTNEVLARLYKKNAEDLGIKFPDASEIQMLAASTDMGNISHLKPSIHPFFKIKSDGMNHTEAFTKGTGDDSAQAPTIVAAKAMMMTAIDVLCEPKVMHEVNNEFSK